MLNIDGLITGLDTSSIVEGLLAVQQSQIDRLDLRRQKVVEEQSAFKSVEAKLLGLQGSLNKLLRTVGGVFRAKQATSSDDEAVLASASEDASPGTYAFRVTELAKAHQVASAGFARPSAEITTGTLEIRVGDRELVKIEIDDSNNTVQGLVDKINSQSDDVSAALLNDGAEYRILLRANETGEANKIIINNQLMDSTGDATKPTFEFNVQTATDAEVVIGSGIDEITVHSSDNQMDDMVDSVNLDLLKADLDKEITISVSPDSTALKDAITGFVDSYNDVIEFINEQSRYDVEAGVGGIFLGSTTAQNVVRKIRDAISEAVAGIDNIEAPNVLSAIGIATDAQGKLTVKSEQLDEILEGRHKEYSVKDIQRLFALDGVSDNPGIEFVLGNHLTQASQIDDNGKPVPFQVNITRAASQAVLAAEKRLSKTTVIDESNDRLQLLLDGAELRITLPHDSYTREELAERLEKVVNNATGIQGRSIAVGLTSKNELEFTSASYGFSSHIKFLDVTDEHGEIVEGNAYAALRLSVGLEQRGQDVIGEFIFNANDPEKETFVEIATGDGRILTGDRWRDVTSGEGENATTETVDQYTADLRVRVNLSPSQVSLDSEAEMSITRGVVGRLDQTIRALLLENHGDLSTIDERFERQIDSFDSSIDRLNERFETRQESILREFAALESAVAQLQSTGSLLGNSLAALPVART